jgi:hypothetical protein
MLWARKLSSSSEACALVSRSFFLEPPSLGLRRSPSSSACNDVLIALLLCLPPLVTVATPLSVLFFLPPAAGDHGSRWSTRPSPWSFCGEISSPNRCTVVVVCFCGGGGIRLVSPISRDSRVSNSAEHDSMLLPAVVRLDMAIDRSAKALAVLDDEPGTVTMAKSRSMSLIWFL